MSHLGGLKIAVLICSQRKPRVGPKIANFVCSVLASYRPTATEFSLVQVDLADWNLPIFDEPTIPAHVFNTADYVQPHTKAWSAEMNKYGAVVFVCPQYNWGYPASVKNAIDYLYHEWNGKPAMIVSYGHRGGGRAAEQLKQVLLGVRMKVVETMPGLAFKTEDSLTSAAKDGELVNGAEDMWNAEQDLILKAFGEVIELL